MVTFTATAGGIIIMNEWISVENKLPEKNTCGRYLVYVENIANYRPLLDNVILAVWCFNNWIYDGWEYNRVTHWMPLPSKPIE